MDDGNWEHETQEFDEDYGEEHRYTDNLEEAKFSEEDIAIEDYKYVFREIHDDEDLGDYYEYRDEEDWEHEAQGVGKGYEEEQENDIIRNGNNNGDMIEGVESISQRLQDQYLRGLRERRMEEGWGRSEEGQSLFWPSVPPRVKIRKILQMRKALTRRPKLMGSQ